MRSLEILNVCFGAVISKIRTVARDCDCIVIESRGVESGLTEKGRQVRLGFRLESISNTQIVKALSTRHWGFHFL